MGVALTMSVSAHDRLQQAERVLADLEQRLDKAKDEKRTLAQRRREVSYGAHAGTVPFASQELDALRRRTIENEMALEDLPAAIEGDRQAVQDAEAAVAVEQRRARETLPSVDKLRAASEAAAAALRAFIERIGEVNGTASDLARSGLGLPRVELFSVQLRRGVATALGAAGLASPVGRDERTSIQEAVGKLADQAAARLYRLAGEQLPEGLPEPETEPEEELELVGAEQESAALGLTESDFAEIATAASERFNQGIDAARAQEIWDAWGSLTAEPAERSSQWIVKRLRLRNTAPSARPDGGY